MIGHVTISSFTPPWSEGQKTSRQSLTPISGRELVLDSSGAIDWRDRRTRPINCQLSVHRKTQCRLAALCRLRFCCDEHHRPPRACVAWCSRTPEGCEKPGDTTMFSKAKMVLAAALVLGSGVATLANDRDGEEGGFVLSGSMDGVNPAYHPDMRADYAAQQRKAGQSLGSVAA